MTAPHELNPEGGEPPARSWPAAAVARWWWIPAGVLIAWAIATWLGSGWALAGMALYTAVNLLGTGLLLREINDQDEGPRSDRLLRLVRLAFVLQLPVGTIALLAEVL